MTPPFPARRSSDPAGWLTLRDGGGLDVKDGAGTVYLGSGAGSGQLAIGDGTAAGTLRAAQVRGDNAASVVFNHNQAAYRFDSVLAGDLDRKSTRLNSSH